MKKLALLGSTGSIGKNACEILSKLQKEQNKEFSIELLLCFSNIDELLKQIEEFKPTNVCILDKTHLAKLKEFTAGWNSIKIIETKEEVLEFLKHQKLDVVINAVSYFDGLEYSFATLAKADRRLALANKESIICGGDLLLNKAKQQSCEIIPIDSEHNSIWQIVCDLNDSAIKEISSIEITASGGPFLHYDLSKLDDVTPEQAVAHPNWSMGKKISIDSATLMNKVIELIEAKFLFQEYCQKFSAVIHPQSILHAIVNFNDGSSQALLSLPDMKVHIANSLFHPETFSLESNQSFNLSKVRNLEFLPIDKKRFPAIDLADFALEKMGSSSIIINAANEVAVNMFLEGRIKFTSIVKIIFDVIEKISTCSVTEVEQIFEIDKTSRNIAYEVAKKYV